MIEATAGQGWLKNALARVNAETCATAEARSLARSILLALEFEDIPVPEVMAFRESISMVWRDRQYKREAEILIAVGGDHYACRWWSPTDDPVPTVFRRGSAGFASFDFPRQVVAWVLGLVPPDRVNLEALCYVNNRLR